MARSVQLILTDIDRTILPAGQTVVPARVREAYHHAMDAGIRVGPATGRGFDWLGPLFDGDRSCFATCVATNGNQVFLDGTKVREVSFGGDVLAGAVQVASCFPHAGVIAFDGATPTLVSGDVADLKASFPSYGALSGWRRTAARWGFPRSAAPRPTCSWRRQLRTARLPPRARRTRAR